MRNQLRKRTIFLIIHHPIPDCGLPAVYLHGITHNDDTVQDRIVVLIIGATLRGIAGGEAQLVGALDHLDRSAGIYGYKLPYKFHG